MFVEIIEGVATAAEIYGKRKSIATMFSRFNNWILHGTTRIVVFGAGGTGKTTLGRYISGELNTDLSVGAYTETFDREDFSFSGKIAARLLVPPGQARRRADSWDELFQILSSGKAIGVINLVCSGYHSTELELSRLRVYQEGLSLDVVRDLYVEQMLTEETEALRTIAPHLRSAKGRLWMITLVTKQDLWWARRHEVQNCYTTGEYGRTIAEVLAHRGAAHFKHELLSAALVSQNLATKDGHVLAQTTPGYDDPLRLANLARFANALADLAK